MVATVGPLNNIHFSDPIFLRMTPHPVIVTMRDNKDYIRLLFYSYYTVITGWGSS